jgi:hypothetical protein
MGRREGAGSEYFNVRQLPADQPLYDPFTGHPIVISFCLLRTCKSSVRSVRQSAVRANRHSTAHNVFGCSANNHSPLGLGKLFNACRMYAYTLVLMVNKIKWVNILSKD